MSTTLIRNGFVISMDPSISDGVADVLVRDGLIVSVAPNQSAEADCAVIDAAGKIVLPGFVDTHRHLWQSVARGIAADWTLVEYFVGVLGGLGPAFRPDDVYASTRLGIAEALDAGITTVLDWAHIMNSPEHTDASINAHQDSGARMILGYSEPNEVWLNSPQPYAFTDLSRVRDLYTDQDSGLLGLALAPRGPEFSSIEDSVQAWKVADELDLPISVHVGVGNWQERGAIEQLNSAGVLRDRTTYIHCSSSSNDELQMILDTGGSVSIAPEVELHMGHGYPPTRRIIEAGLQPSLSIDVCTGIGGDMFGAMRSMPSTQRGIDNQKNLDTGAQPQRLDLRTRDILEAATIRGAEACGLGHRIGSITPGKEADIVMIDATKPNMFPLNNPVGSTVLAAGVGNVEMVMVAGEVVKQSFQLVRGLDGVRSNVERSRNYLFQVAGIHAGGDCHPELPAG